MKVLHLVSGNLNGGAFLGALNLHNELNKNKSILFWVTGFSGSDKTQISKKILKQISKEKILDTVKSKIDQTEILKKFNSF